LCDLEDPADVGHDRGRCRLGQAAGDSVGDLARRNFTINALLLDSETNEVLDSVGGRDDLQAGIICAIGSPSEHFREDRLRMIRAVHEADALVSATMKRLTEIFTDERQWSRSENVSTEDLRAALQRYRSFFGRLLAV
jgi:hypothetical protein